MDQVAKSSMTKVTNFLLFATATLFENSGMEWIKWQTAPPPLLK